MHTFQITPTHAVLFGLSWRAYDSFESRHGQIVEWQSQGLTWSASYKLGADTYVGLIDDSFEHPSKGNLYSAAALVAMNPRIKGKTALVLFISGDEVAMIGLLDGCVIFDVCTSNEDVALHRNNFAQRCTGKTFLTFGPQELGQFDENIEWSELIDGRRFGSSLSKAKVTKFKSDRTAWIIVAAIGLTFLLIIAFLFKNYFDERANLAKKEQQAIANDPVRLYEEGVQRFLNDPKGVPLLGSNIQSLRKIIGAIPLNNGGWSIVKTGCDLESSRCTVEWVLDPTKVGTFKSFEESIPKLPTNWTHIYGPSISKISSSFAFDVKRAKLPQKQSWPKFQSFMLSEVSRWQSIHALGLNIEIKDPVVQAVQSGLQPQLVELNPNAIHAAYWSTSGRPWWLAEIFDSSPHNVTLDRLLVINNGSEITFNAEGKIYVQK
jgi:hypothetical protein